MKIAPVLTPESIAAWQKLAEEEMYAHLLYTHIANYMQSNGYFGTQKYFESEADSEFSHYKKIRDFINDIGSVLKAVPSYSISETVNNIEEALVLYYNAEVELMKKYALTHNALEADGDCISEPLLLEFLAIQRESVGEAGDLCKRYEIAKASNEILLFDQEMGK